MHMRMKMPASHPTMGMKQRMTYPPFLPVSCSRRTVTERMGRKSTNGMPKYTPKLIYKAIESCISSILKSVNRRWSANKVSQENSMKYQYSGREARPSNTAYFLKQVLWHLMLHFPLYTLRHLSSEAHHTCCTSVPRCYWMRRIDCILS